ncbi:hypothetical protein RJT34_31130 [Clitoria ternatea]|uniref:Uncharacterized protein n=1 Tax=Clitoria ternatea TaxID=43366 RepID=A0AAN9F1I8_CLITE
MTGEKERKVKVKEDDGSVREERDEEILSVGGFFLLLEVDQGEEDDEVSSFLHPWAFLSKGLGIWIGTRKSVKALEKASLTFLVFD